MKKEHLGKKWFYKGMALACVSLTCLGVGTVTYAVCYEKTFAKVHESGNMEGYKLKHKENKLIRLADRGDIERVSSYISDVGQSLYYAMGEVVDTGLSKVNLISYTVKQEGDKYKHTFNLAIENTGVKSGIVLRDDMRKTVMSSPKITVGIKDKTYIEEVKISNTYSNLVIPYGSNYIIKVDVMIPEKELDYVTYDFSEKLYDGAIRISPNHRVKEMTYADNNHISQYNDLPLYMCGEGIRTDKARIVVKDRYYSKGNKAYGIMPREGRVLSNVTVSITNITDTGYNTVGEFEFYLVDNQGNTFRESNQYPIENLVGNNSMYLMPGETKEYTIMFESNVAEHRLILKDAEVHKFGDTDRVFNESMYSVLLNNARID